MGSAGLELVVDEVEVLVEVGAGDFFFEVKLARVS